MRAPGGYHDTVFATIVAHRDTIWGEPGKTILYHFERTLYHVHHVLVRDIFKELVHLVPRVLRWFWVKLHGIKVVHLRPSLCNLLLAVSLQCQFGSVMLAEPGRIRTKCNVGVIYHQLVEFVGD